VDRGNPKMRSDRISDRIISFNIRI